METFTYLGSIINQQGGTDADVESRIGKARTAFTTLKNIRKCQQISTHTKVRLFSSNVKSVLLYGSETWRTTKTTTRSKDTDFHQLMFEKNPPSTLAGRHQQHRTQAANQPITSRGRDQEEKMEMDRTRENHPATSRARLLPGTPSRARESEEDPRIPGAETWKRTPDRWDTPVRSWRRWRRTGNDGVKLWMAFAHPRAIGISK